MSKKNKKNKKQKVPERQIGYPLDEDDILEKKFSGLGLCYEDGTPLGRVAFGIRNIALNLYTDRHCLIAKGISTEEGVIEDYFEEIQRLVSQKIPLGYCLVKLIDFTEKNNMPKDRKALKIFLDYFNPYQTRFKS